METGFSVGREGPQDRGVFQSSRPVVNPEVPWDNQMEPHPVHPGLPEAGPMRMMRSSRVRPVDADTVSW